MVFLKARSAFRKTSIDKIMNRRNFLRTGGLLSLPLLSHNPLSAKLNRHLSQLVNPELDRVLVLVRLNGGNDGLNTLVPLDQFANLMANRADRKSVV